MLDRTLPTVWTLTGRDVPALDPVTSRAHVVVVDDVEYLCASIVHDVAAARKPYSPRTSSQMDEELSFLLGQISLLAAKYDPTKGTAVHDPWTDGFRAWLYVELKRDEIDHCRSRFGRDGQKHDLIDMRPFQHAEEAERGAQIDEADPNEDGIRSFADRLVESFDGVAADDPDAWFVGRGWDEHRRHRSRARKVAAVGLGAPVGVEAGDRVNDERGELAA